jgi:hypothetical protein
MKSEDLKKHYREEKKDLNHFSLFRFWFCALFISTGLIHAQIYLNGFIGTESIQSTSQLKKLYVCDFNQDSLKDIVVYKHGEKRYAVHRAINSNKFTESSDKNFELPIDDIRTYSSKSTDLVFASRDARTVGIASISYYGLMQPIFTKQLKSYPSRIYAADMNNDGFNKIIAAGNSFAGIELVNPKNPKKESKNLFSEKSFESLVIFDFNYDYYNDIVAIDFLDNQIVFINNYSNDYFVIERSLPYLDKISDLRLAKFNNDDFYDLIFLSESSVEILLGDSVYSFSKKISVPTGTRASNYAFGDFNNDGNNDLTFLKSSEEIVYVSLNSGGKTFLHPIPFLNASGLEDITSLTGNNTRIISLTSDGKLICLSRVENTDKEFSIGLGTNISAFGSFATNDYSYFFIEDEKNLSLKIFQHSGSQPFRMMYSFPLLKNHDIIQTDIVQKNVVRFFCYSNNSSLLEIIDFDFSTNKSSRNKIVAEGPMNDFVFEKRKKKLIRVMATDGNNVISSVYEFSSKGVKYSHEDTLFNALGGLYSRADTRKAYVWRKKDYGLSFELVSMLDKSKSVLKVLDKNSYMFDENKLRMSMTKSGKYDEIILSYFGNGNNGKLFVNFANNFSEAKIRNISKLALYKSPNHINLLYRLLDNKQRISVSNKILDAESLADLISNKKINRYSIVNINNRNYFAFSLTNDNQITFSGIK